jgi:hypothetical protein
MMQVFIHDTDRVIEKITSVYYKLEVSVSHTFVV